MSLFLMGPMARLRGACHSCLTQACDSPGEANFFTQRKSNFAVKPQRPSGGANGEVTFAGHALALLGGGTAD